MKFAPKYLGYVVIGVLLGGFIGLSLAGSHADGENIFLSFIKNRIHEPSLGLEVGSIAPNFKLYTHEGELINLDDTFGLPVILNFWATWCAPCVIEMPMLQDYYDMYGSKLLVIAVNAGESKSAVKNFVDDYGLSFPTLLDPIELVQNMYSIRAYPTTYFIDKSGVIRAVHVGILSDKKLDSYLSDLGVFDG